jgi:hypothetical protein
VGKFWQRTLSIWTVDEGWPRRRRPDAASVRHRRADHAAVRTRQEELEHFLLAAPATDWGEAVAKARYLLRLFARTPAAEDPRRVRLIADVLADFERLLPN